MMRYHDRHKFNHDMHIFEKIIHLFQNTFYKKAHIYPISIENMFLFDPNISSTQEHTLSNHLDFYTNQKNKLGYQPTKKNIGFHILASHNIECVRYHKNNTYQLNTLEYIQYGAQQNIQIIGFIIIVFADKTNNNKPFLKFNSLQFTHNTYYLFHKSQEKKELHLIMNEIIKNTINTTNTINTSLLDTNVNNIITKQYFKKTSQSKKWYNTR